MIQSLDKQLQVVIRALSDVVAPALDGAEKHVLEQLHLSVATLGFVLQRLPEARRFHRYELDAYVGLAEALLAVAPTELDEAKAGLERARGDGRAALGRPEADIADLEQATRALREATTRLADAALGTPARAGIEAIILERSEPMIAQARQWCSPFGFELKPQSLPQPAW